jgi:RNA polymerase sigma-70 factor (ECF subfamily)
MGADSDEDPQIGVLDTAGVHVLVENHRAFLRFLERRTGSHEAAEDILQDAFARNLERVSELPEEALVPWFYRVLRNAVIDQSRRRGAQERALAAFAAELETHEDATPADIRTEVCQCVLRLAGTLKPEYADALEAVDLDEMPVKDFAEALGLSASNAGVRLMRARQALKRSLVKSCGTCADHGCLDCSCGRPSKAGV